MGRYLDALQNLSIDNFEFNESFGNDTVTPAINSSNSFTNGWLGLGLLLPIWFGLFQYLSARENLFELSPLQAIVSTNALVFTIALVLLHIGVLTSSQHFVWICSLVFVVDVIAILRTA